MGQGVATFRLLAEKLKELKLDVKTNLGGTRRGFGRMVPNGLNHSGWAKRGEKEAEGFVDYLIFRG
jgi:hypothetical protein